MITIGEAAALVGCDHRASDDRRHAGDVEADRRDLRDLAYAPAAPPAEVRLRAMVRNAPISSTVFISRCHITRSCIYCRISVFASVSQFSSATMRSPPSTGSVA